MNNYINSSLPHGPGNVIGDDGVATGFGNTPNGILRGPDQADIDLSLSKNQQVNWPKEGASVQFRADFFNTLNHPNFAGPNNGLRWQYLWAHHFDEHQSESDSIRVEVLVLAIATITAPGPLWGQEQYHRNPTTFPEFQKIQNEINSGHYPYPLNPSMLIRSRRMKKGRPRAASC